MTADVAIDRAYLGGLERQVENTTVDLLDRVAAVLAVGVSELFVVLALGETPPARLRGGRRPKR